MTNTFKNLKNVTAGEGFSDAALKTLAENGIMI